MAYKSVLFDLDGTLVHTLPKYRYLVVPQTLSEFDVVASKANIDRFWFGDPERDVVIKEGFGVDVELFWKTFRKYDNPQLRKDKSRVYDDVDFIGELREKGYLTGIVTGAPAHIAFPEIELLGENNFDGIILACTSNGFKPKPHPHGLHECLNLLKIKSDEAIYVGNGDEDIEAAKNAGVFDILILRGEHDFCKLEPSLKINSLYELRKFLGI